MNIEQALGYINPNVKALGAYAISGGQNAQIKLNQNENPRDLPQDLKYQILDEFINRPWNRYPNIFPHEGAGLFADFIGLPHEYVMMGNGSNELLYTIFMAVLHPEAAILIPSPSFSLYEKIARVLGAGVLSVPMNPDLSFNSDLIISEAQKHQPQLIALSTPNNPTSRSLDLPAIKTIAESVPSLVLVDEAYIEFSENASATGLIDTHPNIIVLRTLSKAFSLAGVRIGFAMADPKLLQELIKPKIPFASSQLAEITLKHVLANYDMIEQGVKDILHERVKLEKSLLSIPGVELIPSDANFLIVRFQDAKHIFQVLKDHGILVRDVSSYPLMENCLRINVGSPDENQALVNTLKQGS